MDTVFHFHAWTFGYEDVWVALSNALQTQVRVSYEECTTALTGQIHVDDYKYGLYKSLAKTSDGNIPSQEGHALFGFKLGNHQHAGCLTRDISVRLHSCEPSTGCPAVNSPHTVFITPVIHRSAAGEVIPELGAGGGGGDLAQVPKSLELTQDDRAEPLIDLCQRKIMDKSSRALAIERIQKATRSNAKSLALDVVDLEALEGEALLDQLVAVLEALPTSDVDVGSPTARGNSDSLPSSLSGLPARIVCQHASGFLPTNIVSNFLTQDTPRTVNCVNLLKLLGQRRCILVS